MSSTHHLSRLQYRVECPDEGQAFELRQVLSSIVTEEIRARMEEISDRYVKDEEFFRIPKLEINLQSASLNTIADELSALFGYRLEEELRGLRTENQSDEAGGLELEIEALFYFLLNGALPRWAAGLSEHIYRIANRLIEQQPDRLLQFLRQYPGERNMWLRIDQQFPTDTKERIVSLTPELASSRAALNTAYAELCARNQAPQPGPELQTIIEGIEADVVLQNAYLIVSNGLHYSILLYDMLELIRKHYGPGGHDGYDAPYCPPEDGIIHVNATVTAMAGEQVQAMPMRHDNSAYIEYIEEAVKLITNTSGIVLLAPFLKPFFTELELLAEREWVDNAAQQRAVHLLHYLSTGQQQQPEWNLVLEKLLCGLAPEFPTERDITLTEKEIAECDALLVAVVGRWTALKNTSSRGLQETFLKRDGLLQRTDKGWHLQVERKTQDVLLEALPWAYSMIKLPWNEYLIEVLW